jgi:dihydropteroate synthase
VGVLRLRGRVLELDEPRIMGIVNVTPDSFYDGGRFQESGPAVEHARRLAA